jgi:hypothetical protein
VLKLGFTSEDINSYYSNRSRNANLHTYAASLRLVHGVVQVQIGLMSTFFSSDHKFISIFLTLFFLKIGLYAREPIPLSSMTVQQLILETVLYVIYTVFVVTE